MDDATHSFFEGPEKKVELVVAPGSASLRETISRDQWTRIVAAAQASILSVESTSFLDAYLLSESSLFVFDDHVTMITCGRTRLVVAVVAIIELVGASNVALLVYERKNEHFPSMQHSTFSQDAALLNRIVPGSSLRFGVEHAHRIEMFVSGHGYSPEPSDVTLEVLMHGLNDERASAFRACRSDRTATLLGLDHLVLGPKPFVIDEFAFDPAGYSLNALAGPHYYTVHVTPELQGSYASFETNWDFRADPHQLVDRVVGAFRPESFDVFAFVPGASGLALDLDGYIERKHVCAEVAGYRVTFASFFRPSGVERAVVL